MFVGGSNNRFHFNMSETLNSADSNTPKYLYKADIGKASMVPPGRLTSTLSTTLPLLGQAKLIHSLSSGIFQKAMRAGGHFSYFMVQLIALLEQSDCSIRVFRSKIPIMKFHAGAFRSMWAVMINCESTWPGLNSNVCTLVETKTHSNIIRKYSDCIHKCGHILNTTLNHLNTVDVPQQTPSGDHATDQIEEINT